MKKEYTTGYDRFSQIRNIKIHFKLNEAEKYALEDLLTVLEVRNLSSFIRTQIFSVYHDLTPDQLQQLDELASQRVSERRCEQ